MKDDPTAYEALLEFLYRAPIGLAELTLAGDVEMVNPMSAQLLMPLAGPAGLANLFDVLHAALPQLRQLVADFAPASGVVCDSLRIALDGTADGAVAPRVLALSLMKFEPARLMMALSDVTADVRREQQGLARRLGDAARYDTLTRMPNRAALVEQLQRAIDLGHAAPGAAFAVLLLNCDRFRRINESLGHPAGDEVLGMIAARLRSALRSHDPLAAGADESSAARIGNDEFAVVVRRMSGPEDAHAVAQRLLDLLAKPYGVGVHQVHSTVSMGLVQQAQMAGDADAVLRDAGIAMVQAKRAGGGRYVVFEPAMREHAILRAGTEADLHRALDEGELFVVYQPVVALQPGAAAGCAGVEALVRWRHPVRGLVSPLDFIGVAEECGLIGAVGEFVLATACRQWVQWQRALGPLAPRRIAVNLSRAQLADAGLTALVGGILGASGMPASRLQLEVTESLADQGSAMQSRLHELKQLGLSLALDDFGTGYSSLSSLHQLPVDAVKIDRSFVCLADTSHRQRVLIEATVKVAHSLGMTTVAEGIETAAQAEVLQRLGCDHGQGYLYARPLTATDAGAWLAARATGARSGLPV